MLEKWRGKEEEEKRGGKKKVTLVRVRSKGGIETKVAGFGDCYLYIIFRCAAPWDRGCTDSKRRRGAQGILHEDLT